MFLLDIKTIKQFCHCDLEADCYTVVSKYQEAVIFVSLHRKLIVCRMSHDFQIFFSQMHNDHLIASEKQHIMQWEDFMKEQHSKQAEVDEEHRTAMERLKEQYAEMERGLAKYPAFGELEP